MHKLPKMSLALVLLLAVGCNPSESTDPPEGSNVVRTCNTNDDCPDDNAFCTGTERCSPTGECISTGNPCLPGEQCNEVADRCDNCAIDENCDDHNACTVEECVDGQCAYSPFVCQYALDCVNGQCEDLCNTTNCDDGDPCTNDGCYRGLCDWTPIWCSYGQHCVKQAGGCVPAPGDPCLNQCIGQGGECPQRPLDEFENYETLRNTWLADTAACADDEESYLSRLAGVCADGTLFLSDSHGFGSKTHFFDGATGQFIGLQSTTDGLDQFCCGRGYWPRDVPCENAVATEDLCGDGIEPSESFGPYLENWCIPQDYGDPCLISFQVPGQWDQPGLGDFDSYNTKRAKWLEQTLFCASDYDLISRTAGSCADGSWFLYEDYYGDYVIDYFDSVSGDFLSRTYQSQIVDSTCCGLSYYLLPRVCENPRVFEVFCGSKFEVGDELTNLDTTPCDENVGDLDPCRLINPFDSDGNSIDPSTIESGDYESRRMFWLEDTEACDAEDSSFGRAVGICADGTKLLVQYAWTGTSAEYYDANSGEFVTYVSRSEYGDTQCCGLTYYPELYFCQDAAITEVICGDAFSVGDVVHTLDGYSCGCYLQPASSECQ